MKPKISIFLHINKYCKNVDACINSLKMQSYQDFELLIFSDCLSKDQQRKLYLACEGRNNFIIDNADNLSRFACMQWAIDNAYGDYMMFLEPEDVLNIKALEILFNSAKENKASICIARNINRLNIADYIRIKDGIQDLLLWDDNCHNKEEDYLISNELAILLLLRASHFDAMHHCLIKRKLLHNIDSKGFAPPYDTRLCFLNVLKQAKTVYLLNSFLCHSRSYKAHEYTKAKRNYLKALPHLLNELYELKNSQLQYMGIALVVEDGIKAWKYDKLNISINHIKSIQKVCRKYYFQYLKYFNKAYKDYNFSKKHLLLKNDKTKKLKLKMHLSNRIQRLKIKSSILLFAIHPKLIKRY